jgi:uncharacterized protein YbcI
MTDDATQHPRLAHHGAALEISNEMVRLYKKLFGRGPSHARTYFAGADIVLCTLDDTFTPAERSLADMGEHQRLRETRLFFQHAREDDFRQSIERITGRRVRAFMSATDTMADVSCEVFCLEPAGTDGVGLHAEPRGRHDAR